MCIDDIDAVQPYRPQQPESPEVGRLKRKIALLESELRCYREVLPGRKFSATHRMLVDEEFFDED